MSASWDVYRVSSSVKVQQMEAELSHQLSALNTEMEENGFPSGAHSRCYSSVRPPKDVSFFRAEREQALRNGLQVADSKPVLSPADLMHRELESCLSLEYTPDSLPLLLHQFYTDRSYHLAQIKYLLMLRWRRFCRHTSVIEKLYPHYKDQMLYLTNEYEDVVQRARRLATSREKILTGHGKTTDLLTGEDVLIYLRWLICHLHCVQTVHNFLRVLHYIPACERRNEEQQNVLEEPPHDASPFHSIWRLVVPLHAAHLEEFLPELQGLMDYFHLTFDLKKLRTTADEMELFCLVWREFRERFRQQEEMKTFPQSDGSEVKESQWGRKSGSQAVRKEATWIRFIQVKPKRDPWQQKLGTKLKEKKCVDELLKTQSRFLQVPDVLHVAAALRERAADVSQPAASSSASLCGDTRRHMVSEIWTRVYSAAALTQETEGWWSRSTGGGDQKNKGLKNENAASKRHSCSLEDSLQLLGLDDSAGASDPVLTSGAHLSLLYLRHLKLRQLQRVSLGLLNYLRSVERTLTFDLAGLQMEKGEVCSTAEETGWMNAARGGGGEAGGLGSQQFIHNSPVDSRVCCSEFMEFAEVENLHDFYSVEQQIVHTQDQRGLYVVYEAALKDLQQLEDELLLIGSHFIHRDQEQKGVHRDHIPAWARTHIDRVAVLLDLWTCETEFLESKVQLLNCYFEAYQHTSGTEERFALARVITDITHSRPHLDLNQDYFVKVYRAEIDCLLIHQQLIRNILDNQVDKQRQYVRHIWRNEHEGSSPGYGLPPNFPLKHLVSLSSSSPALMNVFLLEVHPSLCLASAVYDGLFQAHTELCQLQRATSTLDKLVLKQKLLQRALQTWSDLPPPGDSYSTRIQKDLFSDVFFEDPVLVQDLGLSLVRCAEEKEMMQGREKQAHAVETFSRLLELVTIRHRLLESASETAHLTQLYRNVASELGFDDFHLYLRPVQFEVAEQKHETQPSPVFIPAVLEDDGCVDRFIPTHLPLSIQELDEIQIGRFSFSSKESVTHLMNRQSVENLQVSLACQLTQRNALIGAVKLAFVCHWAGRETAQVEAVLPDKTFDSEHRVHTRDRPPSKVTAESPGRSRERLREAFVSIQLEKVGLRDEMLNSFMEKKQAVGGLIKTPEEAAKIKRRLIIHFLRKFSLRISQHCVRAQIVEYYHSLTSLLEEIPTLRKSYFTMGPALSPKISQDSGRDMDSEPRSRQQLLSAEGETVLNLWLLPHFTEILHMFKTQPVSVCDSALRHTLQIASALHDVIYYLVSFSRLGNTCDSLSSRRGEDVPGLLSAGWGGSEGVGAELQELQHQIDCLPDPSSPESVCRLLQLRRSVLLLQFDTAVRHFIREAFLSSGDVSSFQSVSDNMMNALPLLSDSLHLNMMSLSLRVPQPLQTTGCQAQRMYPWRSFLACHGLFPLHVWDVAPIEYCMQLCLSGLSDRSRQQANAATLSVSLLMEDVLNGGQEAGPVSLPGNQDDLLHQEKPENEDELCMEADEEEGTTPASDSAPLPQDPIRAQSVLRGFLLLTKQLHLFRESWAQTRLGPQVFTLPDLYQTFVKLYRAEIFYPSMRSLAQHMGKGQDYEVLVSGTQSLLPPPGASEVDVKMWQLHKLLESTECDMIRAVQRRISRETTLVLSERTQHDSSLPTELWKKSSMKYSLSPERPQIVEVFVQQLMEEAEEAEGKLCLSKDLLQQSLTQLGCSVMERERRSFLLYSQFYEQILQQETQLLRHREQDLKQLRESQTRSSHNKVSAVCRGMMLEVSALQAQVAHLEEKERSQEKRHGLKFREHYEPLIRHLCSTCIQLKGRLEEQRLQMGQDVSEMVNRIRGEGVERMMKLKRKYGCTKEDDRLTIIKLQKEEVHELQQENRCLSALLCKLKTLRQWRRVVEQEKLHRRLLQAQQREISCRSEALRVKMGAEEEVIFLREELEAVRSELTRCQAERSCYRTLLNKKTEELHVARHQSAQEARSRQELDSYRVQSLEKMRADVEDGERRLRELSEQLDRDSRMNLIHRQRSAKEIRQVSEQLHQERSFKQEAFQQVVKLQNQVNDIEAAASRSIPMTGQSRTYYTLSARRLSTRSPSAGSHRAAQPSALQLGSVTNDGTLQDLAAERRQQRAETARSRSNARIDRPKAALDNLSEKKDSISHIHLSNYSSGTCSPACPDC